MAWCCQATSHYLSECWRCGYWWPDDLNQDISSYSADYASELPGAHISCYMFWNTGSGGIDIFVCKVTIWIFLFRTGNSILFRLMNDCSWKTMEVFDTKLSHWGELKEWDKAFNSLAPGGFENIFQNVFFKLISWIDTLSNSCETALRSMPQNPSDDKSTLVQVMAWCRQAASHYLSQCCPRSLSPYGVTRPQWVKKGPFLQSTAAGTLFNFNTN